MEQKLHTPEGVRDIYSNECRAKLAVQDKLHQVLHLYGYQDIQTPTFEYFDVFRKEIGTISSRELYSFLTGRGIHWHFGRISLLRSQERQQLCLRPKTFRSVFVMWEVPLSITAVIRDA